MDRLPLPVSVTLEHDGQTSERRMVACRPVHEGFLIRFEDISTREAAGALVNHVVLLPRSVLGPLGDSEFYVEDVVGCEVVGVNGEPLGRVTGTYWNGAHDVMTIVDSNGTETLVPVVAAHILCYDRDAGRLTVDFHE